MPVLSTRIIKSNHCDVCERYLERLNKQGFKYELYDGDDLKNEAQLDEWKVEKFPVVQIIKPNGEIVYQFSVGTFSPRMINYKIEQLQKKNQ